MNEELGLRFMDKWFRLNGFTEDQLREILRLRSYAGSSVEMRIRFMVEETGMSPTRALEEIRRRLKEEGEIPLNREVRGRLRIPI